MTGAADDAWLRSPYRGLRPYGEEDAAFFFGRTRERRLISANLLASRLTILYGESGVGKTSVLRAGVLHDLNRLAEDGADESQREFAVVLFSEWRDPVGGLIAALRDAAPDADADGGSLAEALRLAGGQTPGGVLVILDQFEEYFLYHEDEDGDGSFATEFPRAVALPDLRVNFLVSIREDALAKLDRFKARIPSLFENRLRIDHLDRTAAREAIEKPVERYNEVVAGAGGSVTLEPALADAVLDQLEAHPLSIGETGRGVGASPHAAQTARIETPYLQLVMNTLWEQERAGGSRTLRAATLADLGGAERIVRTHVDSALSGLSADEQEVAARLFRQLVTPSGTKIAHDAADLATLIDQPDTAVMPVLEKLAAPGVRILRPVARPGGDAASGGYEIFHDVLAQAVLDWRLRHAGAQEERRRERERREAEARRRKELRNRFFRIFAVLLLAALIATATLAIFALRESRDANRARRAARSGALAANAIAQLPTDPELSVLLAREAYRVAPTEQARDALRQALPQQFVRAVMRGGGGGVFLAVDGSAFSRDGRRVVTAGEDGTAAVWDARTGRLVRRLRGHRDRVRAAAFSPDGDEVATGSADKTARLWDARTGRLLHVLRGHTETVFDVAFSRDSRRVVTSGGYDRSARVWDVASGRLVATLRGNQGPVADVAFSPSGAEVLTASFDGSARVWNVATGAVVLRLRGHQGPVQRASFSPDGRRIVTASWDGTARIWTRRGAPVATLRGDGADFAAFSPDGLRVVTAGGKSPRLWTRDGRLVATFIGHADFVSTAAFSPDGTLVVTAGEDGTARVWDAATGGPLRVLAGHAGPLTSAVFTPDGKRVVTGSFDGTARMWDVDTGRVLRRHTDGVTGVAFSPDHRHLATSAADGTARIWNVRTGRAVLTLRGHHGALAGVRFSRDGTRVVTAGDDSTARIWDARSGRLLRRFRDPARVQVTAADLSPDGTQLVTTSEVGVANVWDLRTGKVVHVLHHREWVVDASFSPDGRMIVTASRDRTARVWNTATGRSIEVLRGHGGPLNSATFSRDGRLVATTSGDRTARIWSVRDGHLVHELRGHTAAVYDAAFDSGGRRLVTVGDTTTRVWDVNSGRALAILRMHSDNVVAVDVAPGGPLIASGGDDRTARVYRCRTCGGIDEVLALSERMLTRKLSTVERQDFLGRARTD